MHALLGGTLRTQAAVLLVALRHLPHALFRHDEEKEGDGRFDDVRRARRRGRGRGIKVLKTGMTTMRDGAAHECRQGALPAARLSRAQPRAAGTAHHGQGHGSVPQGRGRRCRRLMLDVNCHFRTEGCITLARALEHLNLFWLELDIYDVKALEAIRNRARMPIASLESTYGHAGVRPYLGTQRGRRLHHRLRVARAISTPEDRRPLRAYDVNIATHSYAGGGLGDVVSAHLAACVPEFAHHGIRHRRAGAMEEGVPHRSAARRGRHAGRTADAKGWGTERQQKPPSRPIRRANIHSL